MIQNASSPSQLLLWVTPHHPHQPHHYWGYEDPIGSIHHIFWSCPKLEHFWDCVSTVTWKFTDHPICRSPGFFLLHHNKMLFRHYKGSILIHMLNGAWASILTLWKNSSQSAVKQWFEIMNYIMLMESLTSSLRNTQFPWSDFKPQMNIKPLCNNHDPTSVHLYFPVLSLYLLHCLPVLFYYSTIVTLLLLPLPYPPASSLIGELHTSITVIPPLIPPPKPCNPSATTNQRHILYIPYLLFLTYFFFSAF